MREVGYHNFPDELYYPALGQPEVIGFDLIAHVAPLALDGGDGRLAAYGKIVLIWIEDWKSLRRKFQDFLRLKFKDELLYALLSEINIISINLVTYITPASL